MDLAADRLHRTILDILAELRGDAGLTAELLRAERQFFGGAPDYVPEGAARASALGRFAEWFVLERDSEHLGAVPIDVVGGLPESVRDALRASVCGLFAVEATHPEVSVRDIATGEVLGLLTDAEFAAGDVVVGRVYPATADAVAPSPAAAILRQGQEVVAALERDLARAALDRRLTQAELEALLFRNAGELAAAQARRVPPERLEARLDGLLRAGGDEMHASADLSAALAAAVDGPGEVIGPVLDALAFETDVDLDAVRTTMLELWNEHQLRRRERARAEVPPASPAETAGPSPVTASEAGLGATIAARIERGLSAREDLEALFADVEGMLGGEDEDLDADEEESGAPGFDGDLDALVTEYLWERQLAADSAPARILQAFVAQQRALPVPGVYLEAIPARELVGFLLRVYLAGPARTQGPQVQAHFAALRDFYQWAQETQQYDIESALAECERTLIEPLPRLQRASAALAASEVPATARPRVLRVSGIAGGEVEVLGEGTGPTWIDVPQAAADLRVDDLILAALVSDGREGLRVDGPAIVLPAAAADLLE